jgi:hypothetical protein
VRLHDFLSSLVHLPDGRHIFSGILSECLNLSIMCDCRMTQTLSLCRWLAGERSRYDRDGIFGTCALVPTLSYAQVMRDLELRSITSVVRTPGWLITFVH